MTCTKQKKRRSLPRHNLHGRRVILVLVLVATAACSHAQPHHTPKVYPQSVGTEDSTLQILRGKFNPEEEENFVPLPQKYSPGRRQYLQQKTLEALERLAAAAKQAGYQLRVISATRTYDEQKAIWEHKFLGWRLVGGKNLAKTIQDEKARALEILRYSSMPGTSRHHWGTDLDLHEARLDGPVLSNKTFSEGRGAKFYDWLVQNAPRFGFCQPYRGTPKERNAGKYQHGYEEERWHWSYQPLASEYLKTFESHAAALKPSGFAGADAAAEFYLDYVQNIDPSCR
ncbi:MAG: M15 family metallopeptidase [Turneriella sp.]|nr:M15 family metallopeptidase [Turneriella sp.]